MRKCLMINKLWEILHMYLTIHRAPGSNFHGGEFEEVFAAQKSSFKSHVKCKNQLLSQMVAFQTQDFVLSTS